MNLIYISGYGRSGSTILEIILNKEESIIGLGEISNFQTSFEDDELCSCESKLSECLFWKPIIKKYKSHELERKTTFSKKFSLLFKSKKKRNALFLLKLLSEFYPQKIFVDSSKSTRKSFMRPFFYRKEYDLKIIHVIKDYRDCILSNKSKSNTKSLKGIDEPVRFAFLRTTISWISANMFFFVYSLFCGRRNIHVIQYGELTRNYEKTIDGLNTYLKDYNVILSYEKEFINKSHLIRGNRVSRKKNIKIEYYTRDYSKLTWYERWIHTIICNPIYNILIKQ